LIPDYDKYAELIISTDDNEFKWNVLEKLKNLAQQFHLWKQPNQEPTLGRDTSKDLSSFLKLEDITYASLPLSAKDRTDITAIIEWHLRDRLLPS
jgi:hypothetical protein